MPPISRRSLLASTAMLPLASSLLQAQTPSRRPNIIFILADDMGYADISCYGRRDLQTPNIDRIAVQGTRFNQAYANSPVCTASRVAIVNRTLPGSLGGGVGRTDLGRDQEGRRAAT